MKHTFTYIITVISLLLSIFSFAQSPEKFSYQAVVRDANDNLVQNQSIGIQISILQGSASGSSVYTERHFPITNTNGLVTMQIGVGTIISGSFNAIDWGNGVYFVNTEIDLNGGSNYTISGVSELLSVPYALHAPSSGWKLTGNSGTSDVNNFIGTTDNKPLNIRTNDTLRMRVTTKGQLEIFNPGRSIFIGEASGENIDLTTINNTFIGYQSGRYTTTGNANTAIGVFSLQYNTTGVANTATGVSALRFNTTGERNTAYGFSTLHDNTTGNNNIAVGYRTLYNNTTGNYNTAIGSASLHENTTGKNNTGTGYITLYENTIGTNNSATGYVSLSRNTTGAYNTSNGSYCLYLNTTGSNNTANGFESMKANTTGNSNTANGYHSLNSNTSGNYNTAMGYYSLNANTTGSLNTAIGYRTLRINTTGSYNTAIGYNAGLNGTTYSYRTAIGYNAQNTASYQIRIGNNTVSSIGGYANWSNVSDLRFKTNIQENITGLDFIMKLRPVTYHLDMDAIASYHNTPDSLRQPESEALKAAEIQSGFIAQEVEKAAQSVGFDFSGIDGPKNENDHYSLRYAEFVVPLVKGMQEQQEVIVNLEKNNTRLQKDNEELKKALELLMLRVQKLETK